jgi:hypothetical protein
MASSCGAVRCGAQSCVVLCFVVLCSCPHYGAQYRCRPSIPHPTSHRLLLQTPDSRLQTRGTISDLVDKRGETAGWGPGSLVPPKPAVATCNPLMQRPRHRPFPWLLGGNQSIVFACASASGSNKLVKREITYLKLLRRLTRQR